MNNHSQDNKYPNRPSHSMNNLNVTPGTSSAIHPPHDVGAGQSSLNLMQQKQRLSPLVAGEIIKKRRTSLGLNQRALSELSQVAIHTLSNIEAGKGNPTIETLNRVLNVMGMEVQIGIKG
jgi:DNA-binding XRE family transcriptional regulator